LGKKDSCYICGSDFKDILLRHHLVPRSLGGDSSPKNLVTLCWNCHHLVHTRGYFEGVNALPEDFRVVLERFKQEVKRGEIVDFSKLEDRLREVKRLARLQAIRIKASEKPPKPLRKTADFDLSQCPRCRNRNRGMRFVALGIYQCFRCGTFFAESDEGLVKVGRVRLPRKSKVPI